MFIDFKDQGKERETETETERGIFNTNRGEIANANRDEKIQI